MYTHTHTRKQLLNVYLAFVQQFCVYVKMKILKRKFSPYKFRISSINDFSCEECVYVHPECVYSCRWRYVRSDFFSTLCAYYGENFRFDPLYLVCSIKTRDAAKHRIESFYYIIPCGYIRSSKWNSLVYIHISVMVHSKQRGGEVIVGHKSHILLWEQGGASQVNILFKSVCGQAMYPPSPSIKFCYSNVVFIFFNNVHPSFYLFVGRGRKTSCLPRIGNRSHKWELLNSVFKIINLFKNYYFVTFF